MYSSLLEIILMRQKNLQSNSKEKDMKYLSMIEMQVLDRKQVMLTSSVFQIVSFSRIKQSKKGDMNSKRERKTPFPSLHFMRRLITIFIVLLVFLILPWGWISWVTKGSIYRDPELLPVNQV
jgi:hypothetical protein